MSPAFCPALASTTEDFEHYDSHGLERRSCDKMRRPHRAHDWQHPKDGEVHCWGRNKLPADAESYCTEGCNCGHCVDIRNGIHPRFIMCSKKWKALPFETRNMIAESVAD